MRRSPTAKSLYRRHRAKGRPRTFRDSLSTSLSNSVYQALKNDIITGLFKPSEALSENLLARRYATSRTPVREAAARLQRQGLLRIVANKGFFVTAISLPELNDLYEYRAFLECTCAELAAQRPPDPDLLGRVKSSANVKIPLIAGDRQSYARFIEADTAFHVGIARLTGNHLFISAVADLRDQIERLWYAVVEMGDYRAVLIQEHQEIYKAIENRQPSLARDLMLRHISQSKEKMLKLL